MERTIPEKVGISSENILKFIKGYEDSGLNMHSIMIARYGKVCYEANWKPFDSAFPHRIYSITKSFVGIAVALLVQDGLVDINDPILKYFPEESKLVTDKHLKIQTVRHMLMMATALPAHNWFADSPEDRVKHYFTLKTPTTKMPGTSFLYDSGGSFILGAMVERVTKMNLLDFLRLRIFDKIGMSDNIEFLKCPGGHSWGDSALIMPITDLMKFATFVMNKGSYNGEQILDSKITEEFTKKQIDDNVCGNNYQRTQGYGYQIWRTYDNSFAFFGMGNQDVICVPDKDLVFVCFADNQGIEYARKLTNDSFFELISRPAADSALPENPTAYNELMQFTNTLKLSTAKGEKDNTFKESINGKEFILSENPMGIKRVTLEFNENGGSFKYTNAQGDKEIKFGMCENVFQMFPETGYSDECGTVSKEGHMYKCAASAAWIEEKKLYIKVQIIDKYFGNLHIRIGFNEMGKLGIAMQKNAENFLKEYEGFAAEVLE